MQLRRSLSSFLANMTQAPLRLGFILAFVSINIGYLWTVKDAQFERRAAPTTRLLEQLRAHRPASLLVLDFPINPWMARMAARLVPGWSPAMIRVEEPPDACPDCLTLRWNRTTESFELVAAHEPLVRHSVPASTASP